MKTFHVDRSALPSVTKTGEGYLRGTAIVTRAGVFLYENSDGTTRRELRHPEDVMTPESLASLQMIPITVGHPSEMLSVANADELSVGHTGENVRVDGPNIIAPITIMGKRGIAAVQNGQQELSLGYSLDLVEESGRFDGEDYTHRQTNICYNHLAIVDRARAGKAARLNFDGIDEVSVLTQERPMLKVNVDGIAYDAAPEVANHLTKQVKRADDAESALRLANTRADKAEADRDEARERADKAEKSLTGTIPGDQLNARVQQRVSLEGKAALVGNIDNASALSDRELMIAALKIGRPSVALDGKSDDYISARFDGMIDDMGAGVTKLARAAGVVAPVQSRDDAQTEQTAWSKSVADFNGWRNKQ